MVGDIFVVQLSHLEIVFNLAKVTAVMASAIIENTTTAICLLTNQAVTPLKNPVVLLDNLNKPHGITILNLRFGSSV